MAHGHACGATHCACGLGVARFMAHKGLTGAHARRRWSTGRPDVGPGPTLVVATPGLRGPTGSR